MFLNRALLAFSGFLLSFQVMASGSVLINGKEIKTRDDLHTLLAKQLNLPSNYARNMDSLYYMLSTDFAGNNIIKIKHVNSLKAKLGADYIDGFIQAIMDASEDNPRIIIVLE
ncbi:MAG: barstar family protein [Bacteriovorax sp.]|jgi:RNAse (barnase) inhibitor barstar